MSQVSYCKVEGHQSNPMNVVCCHRTCPQRGLMCSFCLLKNHNDHASNCIPLPELIRALNKANSPQNKEEVDKIGNIIRRGHDDIISSFQNYINNLKQKIQKLEDVIKSQMQNLKQEAQFFVSQQLEKSLEIINQENSTVEQLNEEFKKVYPLLKIQDGKVNVFSQNEKQLEADRIMKMSEILNREVKFNLEQSLEKLGEVQGSLQRASTKKLTQCISENRFGMSSEGWAMEYLDAISFISKAKGDRWLNGVGLYEIQSEKPIKLTIKIYEGRSTASKVVYQQIEEASRAVPFQENTKINQLKFRNAVKLNNRQIYTISIKPDQPCLSYFGMNGVTSTREFSYLNAEFQPDERSNSTSTNFGMFPVFFFEE